MVLENLVWNRATGAPSWSQAREVLDCLPVGPPPAGKGKSGNSRKLSRVLTAQTGSREVERMLCSSVISAMKLSSQAVEAKCFLLRTYIYDEIVFLKTGQSCV